MTIEGATVATSAALGALLTACVVLGVGARLLRRWRERRLARSTERVRPLIMSAVTDPARSTRLPTTGRDGRAVRMIVVAMLPQLRGADRDELAAILHRDGQLDRARRDLRSRRAHRRALAADLLGAAGDTSADAALARLTLDDRSDVRVAAVRALGRLGTVNGAHAVVAVLRDGRVPANTCTMALLRMGQPAGDALLDALADTSRDHQPIVADLLGVLGIHEARRTLEEMLVTSPGPLMRQSAATALGRLGDPMSAPLLIEVLERALGLGSNDLDLAIACVEALGLIGDRRSIPTLTRALAGSHRLSFAAAEALAPMGPRRSRRSMQARDTAVAPVAEILSSRPLPTVAFDPGAR